MPPRAIASQVPDTMSRATVEPVLAWWRSKNSSTIDGGNFGAPPNPPAARSYWLSRPRVAVARSSRVGGCCVGRSPRPARSARRPAMVLAAEVTCSRSLSQLSEIAVSTWVNDGIPRVGVGGKYVPA